MIGHGWVTPNPDGSRARCGGPAICGACAREKAAAEAAVAARLNDASSAVQPGGSMAWHCESCGTTLAWVSPILGNPGMQQCPRCSKWMEQVTGEAAS